MSVDLKATPEVTSQEKVVTNQKDVVSDKVPKAESHPVLQGDDAKNAIQVLKNDKYIKLKFPKVTRLDIDPQVGNQHYVCFSFLPSKGAMPDKDNIYGLVKFRGAFAHETEAQSQCEKIIREVDSNHEVTIAY